MCHFNLCLVKCASKGNDTVYEKYMKHSRCTKQANCDNYQEEKPREEHLILPKNGQERRI